MPKNMSEAYRVVMQLRDSNKKKDERIAELEQRLNKSNGIIRTMYEEMEFKGGAE